MQSTHFLSHVQHCCGIYLLKVQGMGATGEVWAQNEKYDTEVEAEYCLRESQNPRGFTRGERIIF